MSEYWNSRWQEMSADHAPLWAFRANSLGHWIVRQKYRPGEQADIVRRCVKRLGADRCRDSMIGMPVFVHEEDGVPVTPDSGMFAWATCAVTAALPKSKPLSVAEVGPGFGGFAYALAQSGYNLQRYRFIDAPAAHRVQKYFVGKSLPGLAAEYVEPQKDFSGFDLIVTHHMLGEMAADEANNILSNVYRSADKCALLHIITWEHGSLTAVAKAGNSALSQYEMNPAGWSTLLRKSWPFDSNPCVEIAMTRI